MSKTNFEEIVSAPHCVQCGNEMVYGLSIEAKNGLFRLQNCINPECANYGLLTLGVEGMPKDLQDYLK